MKTDWQIEAASRPDPTPVAAEADGSPRPGRGWRDGAIVVVVAVAAFLGVQLGAALWSAATPKESRFISVAEPVTSTAEAPARTALR